MSSASLMATPPPDKLLVSLARRVTTPSTERTEVVMFDLPIDFWTGGLGLLLGGIGIYLAMKADAVLQEIRRQVEAVKRIVCAQRA